MNILPRIITNDSPTKLSVKWLGPSDALKNALAQAHGLVFSDKTYLYLEDDECLSIMIGSSVVAEILYDGNILTFERTSLPGSKIALEKATAEVELLLTKEIRNIKAQCNSYFSNPMALWEGIIK